MELVAYTGLAGACIAAGAILTRVEHLLRGELKTELTHFAVARGGGALVGAVGLVLVPEGIAYLPGPLLAGVARAGCRHRLHLTRRCLFRPLAHASVIDPARDVRPGVVQRRRLGVVRIVCAISSFMLSGNASHEASLRPEVCM